MGVPEQQRGVEALPRTFTCTGRNVAHLDASPDEQRVVEREGRVATPLQAAQCISGVHPEEKGSLVVVCVCSTPALSHSLTLK